MPFQIAEQKQVRTSLFCYLFMGVVLALGYQATCNLWMNYVLTAFSCNSGLSCELWKKSGFAIFAFLFFISLPRPSLLSSAPLSAKTLLWISVLPVSIAFLFGAFKTVSLPLGLSHQLPWGEVYWAWVATPIGEELLFRGWLTSIGFRLQKSRLAGMGPFFPIWLWGTSLAFSVWHLQNVGSSSPGQLVLQLVFTFFAGIWLGVIRWNTGRIWPCIIAHFFINFAADWKLWFVI